MNVFSSALVLFFLSSMSIFSSQNVVAQTNSDDPEELTILNAPVSKLNEVGKGTDYRLYVKPEVKGFVTATDLDHPGATYEDCQKNPSWCVAWPDADSIITRLPFSDPKKIVTGTDPRTGKPVSENFVLVRVEYQRNHQPKDVEGWINASYVSDKKLEPLLDTDISKVTRSAGKACPTKKPVSISKINKNRIQLLSTSLKENYYNSVKSEAKSLSSLVGQCPISPSYDKSSHENQWLNKNVYDAEVLPQMRKLKTQVPSINREDGKKMTWDDLVSIDTLARTIYSEMNECFKVGVQYPMAVAKVAVNRTKNPFFYRSNLHSKDAPTLSKVLTEDKQFSVWNNPSAPENKTILMSLCPASNSKSRNNWKGALPSKQDVTAWSQALQIATEAVLHPNTFSERTSSIKQLFYTSKMGSFEHRRKPKPPPTIGGRPVQSFKCMYLWNGGIGPSS